MGSQAVLVAFALALVCASPRAETSRTDVHRISVAAPRSGNYTRVYFEHDGGSLQEMRAFRDSLKSHGARKVNWFLPTLIVCELPEHEVDVAAWPVPPRRFPPDDQRQPSLEPMFGPSWVARCYEEAAAPNRTTGVRGDNAWDEDCGLRTASLSPASRSQTSSERGPRQNSQLLIGNILAQIVLPESDGSYEDWTDAEVSLVTQKAVAAVLYYQESFSRWPIDVTFNFVTRARTQYEPILLPTESDREWVSDVMREQGFDRPSDEHLQAVNDFNDAHRIAVGADWVFCAFVVRAVNAPNHNFPGSPQIGIAYLGGPCLTLTYPVQSSRGYPVDLTFAVAHHIGHVFWALEESPSLVFGSTCTARSGYLAVQNQNKTTAIDPRPQDCTGRTPVPCIMDTGDVTSGLLDGDVCAYTAGMFGLSDNNNNSVPDALDGAPIIQFQGSSTETLTVVDPLFRFSALSEGIPNANPQLPPEERTIYAPPIKDVRVSVGGTSQITLVPEDGVYDDVLERFSMHVNSLPPGRTDIEVVSRNTFGASRLQKKTIFLITLDFSSFSFKFDNDRITVNWSIRGTDFGAAYDVHRVTLDGPQEDVVVAADVDPSGGPVNGITSYTCRDGDVTPGGQYLYYVTGHFVIDYKGAPTEFMIDSEHREVRASFPITDNLLSSPSPNPFSSRTWLSLRVPAASSPSGEGNPEAGVTVQIYDVAGRAVRDLYRERVFPTVLTLSWDGKDGAGRPVPSGIYFIKATAGDLFGSRKVLVIR